MSKKENENGKMTQAEMYEQICFTPAKDVQAVFDKAQEIKEGQPDELEQLWQFYRAMKFFYSFAEIQGTDEVAGGENLINLYEYAKKGAGVTL